METENKKKIEKENEKEVIEEMKDKNLQNISNSKENEKEVIEEMKDKNLQNISNSFDDVVKPKHTFFSLISLKKKKKFFAINF
jgi:hypothetical protein